MVQVVWKRKVNIQLLLETSQQQEGGLTDEGRVQFSGQAGELAPHEWTRADPGQWAESVQIFHVRSPVCSPAPLSTEMIRGSAGVGDAATAAGFRGLVVVLFWH